MLEKISLARRFFGRNRRVFVHYHPGATSTFRCPRCEYPVLIERDAIDFLAQCACIEVGSGTQCPVPETPRQWLELTGGSGALIWGARSIVQSNYSGGATYSGENTWRFEVKDPAGSGRSFDIPVPVGSSEKAIMEAIDEECLLDSTTWLNGKRVIDPRSKEMLSWVRW